MMIPQHLLLRLLSTSWLYQGEIKLTLNQLPACLPLELPIIEQAKVIASLNYGENNCYIFLDIPKSPKEIQTRYRNVLIGKGWQKLETNIDICYRVGFNDYNVPYSTDSTTYCNKKENASLILTISSSDNSITKATLKLGLDLSCSPCKAEWEQQGIINNIPMPIFINPPQTEIIKRIENSGGESNYNTAVIITTELARKTLFTSYYSQIEEMGWKILTVAENDLLSISCWEFTDSNNNNWHGLFSGTKLSKNNDKYLVNFKIVNQDIIDNYFASAIQAIPLNNNKQISRELAQRILVNTYATDKLEEKLLISQLPSQLPFKLPLLEKTEIVGSLIREDSFLILLEVPHSPAIIEQFYQEHLTAADWEKSSIASDAFKNNGFISSGYKPFEMNLFCNKKQGWELYFNTHPSQANYTDVRLQIKKSTSNSLCSFPLNGENQNNEMNLLEQISAPILNPPDKAEVLFFNPSGSGGISYTIQRNGSINSIKYFSDAIIQTKLCIEELANYYFAQMPKYGWKKISEVKQKLLALGLWTFQNEQGNNFQAIISIIKNKKSSEQYSANLEIISIKYLD